MAIFTDVRRRYVILVFSGRIRAVVAADTITGDVCMIKQRGCPTGGRMAIVAVIPACYMVRVLANRNVAVVTRRARANDLGVVNRNSRLEE